MNDSCNNNGIEVNEWGDNADFEDSIDSHLVEKNSSLQPSEFKSKKEMVNIIIILISYHHYYHY